MFNIFKRKQKDKAVKREIYYIVDIHFKDHTSKGFNHKGDCFPKCYRKFFNWYFNRDSKLYCFQYNNGGMLIINRDNIDRLHFYKEYKS